MGFFQGVNIASELGAAGKKPATLDADDTVLNEEGETFGEIEDGEPDDSYIGDDYEEPDFDDDDDDDDDDEDGIPIHNAVRTREGRPNREAEMPVQTETKQKQPEKKEDVPKSTEKPTTPQKRTKTDASETTIGAGCVVEGNISCSKGITVCGEVKGSLHADGKVEVAQDGAVYGDLDAGLGDVVVHGKVKGSLIHCYRAEFADAKVSCKTVKARDSVEVFSGTVLVGNIEAKQATIEGAVKGDINVEDSVVIKKDSVVKGNICATSINIEPGAVVDGVLQQRLSSKLDFGSIFDENWED